MISRRDSTEVATGFPNSNLNRPPDRQNFPAPENLPPLYDANKNAFQNTDVNQTDAANSGANSAADPQNQSADSNKTTNPAPYGPEIERVLASSRLHFPAELNELGNRSGRLMDGGTEEVPFALEGPVGKIILGDRPTFSWRALAESEGYVVNVFDSNFNKVAGSPRLNGTAWRAERPLARNKTYVWQVTAFKNGREVKSPVRPAPDARFKILDAAKADGLSRAGRQYRNQPLILGILYANAGLVDEARREFQKELSKNPGSKQARQFLRDLRQRLEPN
jgi:hypothetical protein